MALHGLGGVDDGVGFGQCEYLRAHPKHVYSELSLPGMREAFEKALEVASAVGAAVGDCFRGIVDYVNDSLNESTAADLMDYRICHGSEKDQITFFDPMGIFGRRFSRLDAESYKKVCAQNWTPFIFKREYGMDPKAFGRKEY